jgi:hypothetical protein
MMEQNLLVNQLPEVAFIETETHLAHRIVGSHRLIQCATSDLEIASLLERVGYGNERLEEGLKLYKKAQVAFVSRQGALAQLKYTIALLEQSEAVARHIYGEFRSVARLLFRTGVARIDLGLEGKVPEDLEKFIIVSRSVLKMAQRTAAYRSRLAEYGSLDCLKAAVEDLAAADKACEDARKLVLQSTQRWDRVMVSLDKWVEQFCKTMRRDLRSRPDLLIKLGI